MKTTIKSIAFTGVLFAAAAVAFFGWAAFADHIETGFHLPRVDWLPPDATDISFYRNRNIGNIFVYEFHISQSAFKTLAQERNWRIKDSTGECELIRYTAFLPKNHPEQREPYYITAESGYCFNDQRPNGGGILVLYDNSTSTAYVQKSSR